MCGEDAFPYGVASTGPRRISLSANDFEGFDKVPRGLGVAVAEREQSKDLIEPCIDGEIAGFNTLVIWTIHAADFTRSSWCELQLLVSLDRPAFEGADAALRGIVEISRNLAQ
jgi:hypothetical protein